MRHARLRPVEFVDIVKSALIKLRAQGVFLHHERIRTAAASCRIAILFFFLLSPSLLCSFLADKQKQSHMQKVAIAVHILHTLFFELTHTHTMNATKAESNGCECYSPTGLKPAPSTS